MKLASWNDLDTVYMFDLISRKTISASRMTIARVELGQGGIVPGHRHPQEQITIVLKGKIVFTGANEAKTAVAGDVVHTPSGDYHSVAALEDSIVIDVFSPVRDDWMT